MRWTRSGGWTARSAIPVMITAALALAGPAGAQERAPDGKELSRSKLTLTSALRVDLTRNFARMPLHRGTVGGTTVWFVITDVSDARMAKKMGLNFAPRLVNADRGCDLCVQEVRSSSKVLGKSTVAFQGAPDFAPPRLLVPGPRGFPPLAANPGGVGVGAYSPFVRIRGSRAVFNASIIAVGDGPFDVITHTNTHDRVLAIDPANRTVDLLFVEGFANGKPILYLSFEASDGMVATLERATFVPALNRTPFPNGGQKPRSARAAIFSFVNGKDGVLPSPPAQGDSHVILDGKNAEEANLQNEDVLAALREGGDAHNVFDVFPTNRSRRLRRLYSPLWDLQVGMWTPGAVARGLNRARTDSNVIRRFAQRGLVTSVTGLRLASDDIIINCPALAFTRAAPRAPQASKPPRQP